MDEGDGQEPGAPGGGDGEGRRPTEPGAVLRVPGPVQGKSLVFIPYVNPRVLTRLGLIISIAGNKVIEFKPTTPGFEKKTMFCFFSFVMIYIVLTELLNQELCLFRSKH